MDEHRTPLEVLTAEAARLACCGLYVPVPAMPGRCTLRRFLEEILGLAPAYIDERVQTILLDGLAVDNLDAAIVRPGTRLALSAAMPGVAGATLRRGGHYAPMRRGITLMEESSAPSSETQPPFWMELRCFNDIGREQGLNLLRHGVAVSPEFLTDAVRPLAAPLPTTLPPLPQSALVWLRQPPDNP